MGPGFPQQFVRYFKYLKFQKKIRYKIYIPNFGKLINSQTYIN